MLTVYGTFKFLHVAAAIIWVGGIIALAVLNARLAREGNAAALMGARFSFWLAWGLAGVLGSLALGPLFLRPASQRLAALAVRENDARIAGGGSLFWVPSTWAGSSRRCGRWSPSPHCDGSQPVTTVAAA